MSFSDKIPGLGPAISNFKVFVFGENNSRIDTILDYFFSLRQEKRSKIILYSIISFLVIFILIISLYFMGLHNLQVALNKSADNIKELNNLQPSYYAVNQEFKKLTEILHNNQYASIVSVLEQKTKELGVESTNFPEKPILIDLQSNSPLYGQFQKVKIDYKLPNISLKKIIDYVNTIQQMDNRYKVTKLDIQQKFENKLYFSVNITVETYVPAQKNQE